MTPDTLSAHGQAAYDAEDYETAIAAFRQARQVWREMGDPFGEAQAAMDEGRAHARFGNIEAAIEALQDALKLFKECDALEEQAAVAMQLGQLMVQRGEYKQAADLLAYAAQMFDELDDVEQANEVLATLEEAFGQQGDWLNRLIVRYYLMRRTGEDVSFSARLLGLFLRLVGVRLA
nr:tetratricopeptide repeat protein [Ardenticatena sp.]